MIWHIISLAVFTVVAIEAVALYHRRGQLRIQHTQNEADGWAKRRTPMGDVWICPRCRNPVFTRQDINGHMGLDAPCGILMDAEDAADPYQHPGYNVHQVARERTNAIGIEGSE